MIGQKQPTPCFLVRAILIVGFVVATLPIAVITYLVEVVTRAVRSLYLILLPFAITDVIWRDMASLCRQEGKRKCLNELSTIWLISVIALMETTRNFLESMQTKLED